jgi:hypothetical protein
MVAAWTIRTSLLLGREDWRETVPPWLNVLLNAERDKPCITGDFWQESNPVGG